MTLYSQSPGSSSASSSSTSVMPPVDELTREIARRRSAHGAKNISRVEIDAIRDGSAVGEAVLAARAAEWELLKQGTTPVKHGTTPDGPGSPEGPARMQALAGARAAVVLLDELLLGTYDGNDFLAAKPLLAARGALVEALAAHDSTDDRSATDAASQASSDAELVAVAMPPDTAPPSADASAVNVEASATKARARTVERLRARQAAAAAAARRLAVLAGGLAVAVVLSWLIYPQSLRAPLAAPAVGEFAPELGLVDIQPVGLLVYARSNGWRTVAAPVRVLAAERACAWAQQQGFTGLVLKDLAGDTVYSCAGDAPERR